MKTLMLLLFTVGLFNLSLRAQQQFKYHVYVIAANGKVVNKTFASSEELNQDKELRALQIGGIEDNEFAFTPDEEKHKAVLVEELSSTGEQMRSFFQAWDGEAAKEIQKTMGFKLPAPAAAPQPANSEKEPVIPAAPAAPKGFEQEVLAALIADKLILDNTKVTIKLTKHNFLVNEKKQPQNTHQKYIKLIESIKGEKLSDNFQFHYSVE